MEIELATICGSDVQTVTGLRTELTPSILDHEAIERIVEVGHGREEMAQPQE